MADIPAETICASVRELIAFLYRRPLEMQKGAPGTKPEAP